jgi:hypothetical protein
MVSKKSKNTLAQASAQAAKFLRENRVYANDPIRYDDNLLGRIRVVIRDICEDFFYEPVKKKGKHGKQ